MKGNLKMTGKSLSDRAEGEIRRWIAENEKKKRTPAEPPKEPPASPAPSFNNAAPKEPVEERPTPGFFTQLGARLDNGLKKLGLH